MDLPLEGSFGIGFGEWLVVGSMVGLMVGSELIMDDYWSLMKFVVRD